MFYEVIPEGRVDELTYNYDNSLLPGQIVMVPLGKRAVPGVVVKKVAQPNFATKKILKILYSKPLPQHLLKTIKFVCDYYLVPSGLAVSLILPNGVEKKRRKTEQTFGKSYPSISTLGNMPTIQLNPHQKKALQGLQEASGTTKLLFGVTGSGKTNIYLKLALNALERQTSTILLVPEIALTGQLVKVFTEVFGDRVVVIHSKQTEAERHLIFNSLLETTEPKIVIGPRSALFAPVEKLGLVIIDEAHEATYYQENAPRYSAIRVASAMAQAAGCSCILGSATPTIEDYYIAQQRGSLVPLTKRAKDAAVRPEIKLIDFKDRGEFSKNRYFSNELLAAIRRNLEQNQQTLIFHNRRGSSPLTICENCGEELMCPNCFLPLTLHADSYDLECHTCGFKMTVPKGCPKCGHPDLIHKGFGTKLLESELTKLFPKARVKRFDADNKKGEGMEVLYDMVRDGEVDILVGTQGLAKGLDLPRLATVGVVAADTGLSLPDFAAEERVFQLLTQVMGRVGRGHLSTAEVFIQTYRPEHPVLSFAINEDYSGFATYTLKQRQKGGFPPYKHVLKLSISLKTESLAIRKVRELIKKLSLDGRLSVSPPVPAFHERTAEGYSWEVIVRSSSRKALIEACEGLDKNFRFYLDPPSLL
jgi:primosomal protein N' (replication factor Y)